MSIIATWPAWYGQKVKPDWNEKDLSLLRGLFRSWENKANAARPTSCAVVGVESGRTLEHPPDSQE